MEGKYSINEIKDFTIIQDGVIECRNICLASLSILLMHRVSYMSDSIDSNGSKIKTKITAHRVDAAPLFINKIDEISKIISRKFTSAVDNQEYTISEYVTKLGERPSLYTSAYKDLISHVMVYYTSMSYYLKMIYRLNKNDMTYNRVVLSEDSIRAVEDLVKQLLNIIKRKSDDVWNIFAIGYTNTINEAIAPEYKNQIDSINNWITSRYDTMLEILNSSELEVLSNEG